VLITAKTAPARKLLRARSMRKRAPRKTLCRSFLPKHGRPYIGVGAFGDHRRSGNSGEPREGALLRAHGGTLLLDEIGDLPIKLQIALAKSLDKNHISSRTSMDVKCSERAVDLYHLS